MKRRILIVDDNEAIHNDFHAILTGPGGVRDEEILALEAELFSDGEPDENEESNRIVYQIDDALQGQQAIAMVDAAADNGNPYALVFMDIRMPPGIDGIQAMKAIWERHGQLEIVICTAYSDYSWDEIIEQFGFTDQLLFLRKPFDGTALKQVALSLTTKWQLRHEARLYIDNLEREVERRTIELNRTVADLMATNLEARRMIQRLEKKALADK